MRRLVIGFVCAVAGYALAAFVGYWLIEWLSDNAHDRSLEAAMTGVFVCGPIGALAGFFGGFVLVGRRRSAPAAPAAEKET